MSVRYSSIEIFPSLDVSASSKRLVRAGDTNISLDVFQTWKNIWHVCFKDWLKTTKLFSVVIHYCVISHPDGFCCPSAFWQSPKPSWKRTFLQWSFSSSVIQYSIQTKLKWIKLEAILLYHKSFPIVLHNLKLVSAPKEAQLDTAHKIQRNLRNLGAYLVGTTHIPRCP